MSLPVIVLAGGLATRMQPVTARIPKSLIEVAGRPFAEHQVELLAGQGIDDIVFCIGHLGEQVVAALGDGTRWGVRLRYLSDGPTLVGTGGAVRHAVPLVGPDFMVMYGDSYLQCDFRAVERAYRLSGEPALMTVFRNDDQFDRSNVEFADDRIVRYDKVHRDAGMRHIDYGLGVFNASAFDPYAEGQAFDLAIVYQRLLGDGRLAGFEVAERFFEIGSPAGLEDTRALLEQRRTVP